MNPRSQTRPARRDFRRIGRKVLASSRTVSAIEGRLEKNTPKKPKINYVFKKWHIAPAAAVVLLPLLIIGSMTFVDHQAKVKAKRATDAETARLRSVADKAEECRAQKLQEKASQIGTITYGQLYGEDCTF